MYSNRTCLTPRDAKLIVRYLDGVDDVISARLASGFNPHEDHLTSLLCEMLDDNLTSLSALAFPLSKLREELAFDPKVLKVSLSIEVKKYPPHIERRLTSSDIGVIVSYRDNVASNRSFEKGALFQAKKLYRSQPDQAFSLHDPFKEFDANQLLRLAKLENDDETREMHLKRSLHSSLSHYLLYCPRLDGYDEQSREEVHHLIIPSSDIFDFAEGWHKYELANDPARHIPGMLATGLGWLASEYLERHEDGNYTVKARKEKPTARQAFEQFWQDVYPFSWFLVYEMLMGNAGKSDSRSLSIVRGSEKNQALDNAILPKYVMTLQVEAGTARG
jgi:hypothetical protein